MRNYKLDTSLLPQVWITWETTKGRFYLNCQTGKKKTTPEPWMYEGRYRYGRHTDGLIPLGIYWGTKNSDKVWVTSGNTVKYAYAKYHADIDKLEVAVVEMPTTRAEEPHRWQFAGDRFYIGKDKSIVAQNGDTQLSRYQLYKYHTPYSNIELIRMLLRCATNDNFTNEFKKFIGDNHFIIGNGTSVEITYAWHLQRWYQTSQKARGKGKEQKLTDELVQLPHQNICEFADKLVPKTICRNGYQRTAKQAVYYERINDEWSVLRAFSVSNSNPTELWRMYISDDGRNRIVSRNGYNWVPSRQPHCWWGMYEYLINQNEAIENCNRIKYALTIEAEESEMVQFLMTILRFPEIEQLSKLGYSNLARRIANSNTPKAYIKDEFGGYYKDKEKNLLRKIGLTKPQLDHYMEFNHDYHSARALRTMRSLFGEDLSHMDMDSFKKCFRGCVDINGRCYSGFENYANDLQLDKVKLLKNLIRLSAKRCDVYTIFADTLSDYRNLNYGTQPDVDWYFDNISDLVRTHDAIIELKRIQDEERRAMWDMEAAERRKKEEEKRIKMDKERQQYEYEDDEYIIRLPKDLTEIVDEGRIQRICIGGYTSRHALAQTNIFFLRKKDDEETPFYAIEMNNNKVIVQIHGYCNQWLGVHPEAIPTVVRWLRKHEIQCDTKILTCASRGYSATGQYVTMPVVD